ncbi:MAG TPA: CPBP family intramembrane glutamic endopeptidase [Dyella sp.]|uniref:CPBP family intramembrane glutamic endopeptidase n=1 Tax=Dyella sp. TaxID=1869338 RepID=UPI002CD4D18A|nr:CPBP family intramembrane glutamic endopeptidase [Dyella sp.]HUB91425.1 CPBP family intramembrane glutamic endopeptidase [Dyella sp.]
MSETKRSSAAWICAGYVLVALVVCLALGRLAAHITAATLLDQAQQQLARVESGQPLWQWSLRKPRDLVAGRAFGNATAVQDGDALRVTSEDGTPFELGLPIAWSVDLKHWPILQLQLQSNMAGTLGLVWQGSNHAFACLAPAAHALTADTRSLRIDLRDLVWNSSEPGACATPGIAQMLRLRLQMPRGGSLRLSSAALLTTEPMPRLQDVAIDLSGNTTQHDIGRITSRAQNWAMPLFRLPDGSSAEAMLAWRDQLRARWPAALIVAAGDTPQAEPTARPHPAWAWSACIAYLLVLLRLVLHPVQGRLRPWIEIICCLLGPLWLIIGLHWGLRPTPLGVTAFAGGLAYALVIERQHLPRLWRWPEAGRHWLWPLATLPVTLLLMVFYGHAPRALLLGHVVAYFAWAWLQQWLMLIVLLRRFEQILPRPNWAIVPVALVFALLHTPNGMLMQLCLVGELWWAWCFLRSRSVLPVALAHAICALLVESALAGGALLRSLEVSARFFL